MSKENEISNLDYARRRLVRTLVTPAIPEEVISIEPEEGIAKAEEFVDMGYAVCAVYSHPCQTDPGRLMAALIDIPFLARKRMYSPIAVHQNILKGPQALAAAGAIKVQELTTEESLKVQEKRNRKRKEKGQQPIEKWHKNDHLQDVTKSMMDVFKDQGVVILSPQGTRQERLKIPENPTMGHLFAQLKRRHIEDVIFMFFGFGIPGVEDYHRYRGYNLGRRFTIYQGSALTFKEVLAKANGKFDQIDRVMVEELNKYVPPAYQLESSQA